MTSKFNAVAPIAWGAVIVVTLGIFIGTLMLDARKR